MQRAIGWFVATHHDHNTAGSTEGRAHFFGVVSSYISRVLVAYRSNFTYACTYALDVPLYLMCSVIQATLHILELHEHDLAN